jgi:hypothetical protein
MAHHSAVLELNDGLVVRQQRPARQDLSDRLRLQCPFETSTHGGQGRCGSGHVQDRALLSGWVVAMTVAAFGFGRMSMILS